MVVSLMSIAHWQILELKESEEFEDCVVTARSAGYVTVASLAGITYSLRIFEAACDTDANFLVGEPAAFCLRASVLLNCNEAASVKLIDTA